LDTVIVTKPLEGVTLHLEYVGNKKLLMVMKLTWHAGTRNWSIKAARNSELLMTMTQLGVTLYLDNIGGQNLRAPYDHNPVGRNPYLKNIGGQNLEASDDHDL
jgi:hypothetical protein